VVCGPLLTAVRFVRKTAAGEFVAVRASDGPKSTPLLISLLSRGRFVHAD